MPIHGSCYKIVSTSVNWNAAESACKAMGSHLAMVKTHAEQQALWPKMGTTVWIGLHRDPKDNSRWLWIDGSRVTYTNWYSGEPNGALEKCGEMYPSSYKGKWNDAPCNINRYYLCETKGKER